MSIYCGAMFADALEQVRRVWRSDPLRGKMTPNVEISGIFALFDNLMMLPGFTNRFLLVANIVGKTFVARFVVAAHFGDVLFDCGKFFFGGSQFFLRHPRSVTASHASSHQLSALVWQTRATRADAAGLSFQICRRRRERLELGQFFQ